MTDMLATDNIIVMTDAIKDFLLYKNSKYGNSVNDPIHIFNKASADTLINARIDDKLSRIKNSDTLRKNDVIDLIGYLIFVAIQNDWMDLKDLKD